MFYIIYILEDKLDKTWYIGFTHNLKQRIKDHISGHSPYTSRMTAPKLIYAEMYLNKKDALGREKFLKSGAGHRFIKKQLTWYFEDR